MTFKVIEDHYAVQECQSFFGFEEAAKNWHVTQTPFPDIDMPNEVIFGVNSLTPVSAVCRVKMRWPVAKGLPPGHGTECESPVCPEIDMDAGSAYMWKAKDFPVAYKSVLNSMKLLAKIDRDKFMKVYPELKAKGVPLPDMPPDPLYPDPPSSICFQYSCMSAKDAKWNLPDQMPQWMELMIRAEDQALYVKKLDEFSTKYSTRLSSTDNLWARVRKGSEPRALMSPQTDDVFRNIIQLAGAPFQQKSSEVDKWSLDSFYAGLMCKLQCEWPILRIESYHLGCYFPPEMAQSPGIKFPAKDVLQQFLLIEKEEDPYNKFETKIGYAFKKRLKNLQSHPDQTQRDKQQLTRL